MGRAAKGRIAIVAFAENADAELASVLLEESGYQVVVCPDPTDLVTRLAADAMDVAIVFADPDRVPMEELRAIRSAWPWIEVITTGGDPGRNQEDRYLRKPWRPLDLLIVAEAARDDRPTLH